MKNHWDERFSSQDYYYGKEPNAFLVEVQKYIPKGNVLCIAEGEGRNSVFLASKGYDVTAWDFAPSGLDKINKLAAERGVKVRTELHDLADVEWEDEKWDAIVHIFGNFSKPVFDRTMEGIQKSLKPGGYYVSELYTKEQLQYGTGGPGNPEFLCDPKSLMEKFEDYFFKHFYVGETERNEGIGHSGLAHVVQSVFIKR